MSDLLDAIYRGNQAGIDGLLAHNPKLDVFEAAVENNDPAEVRRLLADVPFTEAQRRHVENMLDAWDEDT